MEISSCLLLYNSLCVWNTVGMNVYKIQQIAIKLASYLYVRAIFLR